jgi:hypothetical protein
MHRMIVNSVLDILQSFICLLILLELFSRGESFLLVLGIVKIIIINEQASFIMINVIWVFTFSFSFFENLSCTNVGFDFFLLILFRGSNSRLMGRRLYSDGACWLTSILLRRSILDLLVRVLYLISLILFTFQCLWNNFRLLVLFSSFFEETFLLLLLSGASIFNLRIFF